MRVYGTGREGGRGGGYTAWEKLKGASMRSVTPTEVMVGGRLGPLVGTVPFTVAHPWVIVLVSWVFHNKWPETRWLCCCSVIQSCVTLCDPMNCSMPGLPVHHKLLEFTQTRVHRVSDAIQPSHPLLSPSPPAPNPSQHQSLFQWVNSSHEVAKVLEIQL